MVAIPQAFLTTKDIMEIVGCGRNTALRMKKDTNVYTESLGVKVINRRKCLASHFSQLFLGKEKQ